MNAPVADKRYKLLDATMRRHGYAPNALIEALHIAQQSWGFLEIEVLRYVARSLKLPLSKVYGVATFYNLFLLKPPGAHVCVLCTGTACYIKGAPAILAAVEHELGLKPGMTTPDGRASVLQARCFGSCALAPVGVFDGAVAGNSTPQQVVDRIRAWLDGASEASSQVAREGGAA